MVHYFRKKLKNIFEKNPGIKNLRKVVNVLQRKEEELPPGLVPKMLQI